MTKGDLAKASEELESLTEHERRALRGSRFSVVQPSTSSSEQTRTRFAHPGGPLATNKAAALAKFLQRKLEQPGGLDSLDPALVERAVHNAKDVVNAGSSRGPVKVRHVRSFSDSEEELRTEAETTVESKRPRKGQKCKLTVSGRISPRAQHKHRNKQKKMKHKMSEKCLRAVLALRLRTWTT